MTEPTCKSCRHWHRLEGLLDGAIVADDAKPGECRGAPPSVVSVLGADGAGRMVTVIQSRYPQFRPDHPICGFFKERAEGV